MGWKKIGGNLVNSTQNLYIQKGKKWFRMRCQGQKKEMDRIGASSCERRWKAWFWAENTSTRSWERSYACATMFKGRK